MSRTS